MEDDLKAGTASLPKTAATGLAKVGECNGEF